jgi:hypothetical protein
LSENAEAILNFVSANSSVADAFIETVQRLGAVPLAQGGDSLNLGGLRGLIEGGPEGIFDSHPFGDPTLTLEHIAKHHPKAERGRLLLEAAKARTAG